MRFHCAHGGGDQGRHVAEPRLQVQQRLRRKCRILGEVGVWLADDTE
ncbi:hypothetical protein [Amycolatopsis palatopharyngis]|nr:hypothetical protein [Amycolatopsis palatopharyngis]